MAEKLRLNCIVAPAIEPGSIGLATACVARRHAIGSRLGLAAIRDDDVTGVSHG